MMSERLVFLVCIAILSAMGVWQSRQEAERWERLGVAVAGAIKANCELGQKLR